jgi:ferrochelatase
MEIVDKTLDYFKRKYGIESPWQVLIILIVFTITGSSSVFVRKPVFAWLGITSETSLFIQIPLYIIVMIPAYQVLLLFYGTLLGQFDFFWKMELKMLGGFKRIFVRKSSQATPHEPQ